MDVYFVDYGDYQLKSINEIYKIRTEFMKLKFQAIQCSLAHIRYASCVFSLPYHMLLGLRLVRTGLKMLVTS